MQGKIALEEHFAIPDTLMDSAGFVPDSYWPELKDRLLDIQDKRLRQMDERWICDLADRGHVALRRVRLCHHHTSRTARVTCQVPV